LLAWAELGAAQTVQLKGDAKMSVHPLKMEQGSTYRLTVKAHGFLPEISIDGQHNTSAVGPSNAGVNPGQQPVPGAEKTSSVIFVPPQTREYQIKVGHLPTADVAQGPLPYTLTVERAPGAFKPVARPANTKLEVSEISKRFEQGKTYSIAITGKGFAPIVQIMNDTGVLIWSNQGKWFGFGPDAEFVNTITFKPGLTMNYRIVVLVSTLAADTRQSPFSYTTQVTELKVEGR
jgi:hypothetical protein